MEDITFIVHRDWLENIKGLPQEQQDRIIGDLVRYGVEMELEHQDDAIVVSFVNLLKSRIDYSKSKYVEKKFGGRKKKASDQEIYEIARSGKSAADIAEMLGVSKSSVDHSEGWRHRKEEGFSF